MNIKNTILLGGAALMYLNNKDEYDQQIAQLQDLLNQAEVEKEILRQEHDKYVEDSKGASHLVCTFEGEVSRITKSLWNGQFSITITNKSEYTCRIAAVRVFCSVGGYTSTWAFWNNSGITIQPKKTVTYPLHSVFLKKLFADDSIVKAVQDLFKQANPSYKFGTIGNNYRTPNPLEVLCDADMLVTSQGQSSAVVVKDFAGKLYGLGGDRCYSFVSGINGTDMEIFDKTNAEDDKEDSTDNNTNKPNFYNTGL